MAVYDSITKQCSKCKTVKPVAEFGKQAHRKDGLNPWCRACKSIDGKSYNNRNKERLAPIRKAWNEANSEAMKPYHAAYYQKHRAKLDAINAEWAKNHPKERAALSLAHYYRNKDTKLSAMKQWQQSNKLQQKAYRALYRKNNPELHAALSRNYKARKRNAEGMHSFAEIRVLLSRQKYACVYCKINVKDEYHVDHITALANGGSNGIENLQILCPTCNMKKGSKDRFEFARQYGMLF